MIPVQPSRRPWTFMVYMAGDNGKIFNTAAGPMQLMAEMTNVGYTDLMEMGQVGTTANVAITCLFDTLDRGAFVVEVRKGRGWADSLVQPLSAVNTGHPDVLRDFIVRSMASYPAERYALVIWNHGTGWLDTDSYAVVRAISEGGSYHKPIFRTTPRKLSGEDRTRPIAFDDSSKDFLDTADLRRALSEAQAATGRRLDLIGMDACLMAMVEGARELAPYADYFVASQEVEPMAGWPYGPILRKLDSHPGLAPADLAVTVVEEFARSYGGRTRTEDTVTQSAIVLDRTAETEALAKGLADAILARKSPGLRRLVNKSLTKTFFFQDRNYRDLGDFAARLTAEAESTYPPIAAAARALADHMRRRGNDAAVLKVGFVPAYERATGLSVYLPSFLPASQRKRTLEIYRSLLFAQATGWDRLLEWLFDEF